MEARLVPEAGYDFAPVELKGIQRRLSWHNFCYNLSSMELLCTCWGKIRRILRQFQPDVVVGTGGYVSGPVLRQAARMGFRTVTHESNAYPGMTTRLIAKTADKVLLAVPEAAAHLECRREAHCHRQSGAGGDPLCRPCRRPGKAGRRGPGVHSLLWRQPGSRAHQPGHGRGGGALCTHRAHPSHPCHRAYGTELFPECLRELGADITGDPHMDIREYIRDMADCLAAADLVICRSGAMTLTELEAAGRHPS